MRTYPRDEFDAVPESPRRQGVHRTREGEEPQRRSGLGWILAAGILALVIGAVAFFLLPRLGIGGSESAVASAPSTSQPAPEGSQSATSAPAPAPTSAAPRPTATPTESANKALEVGVYNATGTAGLGNRVATTARTAGWTVTDVGNWAGAPVNSSVVYYRSAADAGSAKALAADLGIQTVLEAPALGLPLAAVVGPGYAG
jgi:hypothetical protein